jgi:1-acyl-sn-glycerol-3-phosphate acyltransferase
VISRGSLEVQESLPPPAARGIELANRLPASQRNATPPPPPEPAASVDDVDDLFRRPAQAPLPDIDDGPDDSPSGATGAALASPDVEKPQAQEGAADKEPATWRSRSKPPLPMEPSGPRNSSAGARRSPRSPFHKGGVAPGADIEGDPSSDIAPIGPTEAASARAGAGATSEPLATAPAQAPSPTTEEIEHQIHDLEARLDRMIRQSRESRAASGGSRPGFEPPPRPPLESGAEPESVAAKELLSTDFYLRQWSRIGMRNRSEEIDEFGLDPKYEARYKPFFEFLYKHYFRVETQGTENIPGEGRCLIVSNHSGGALPYDGLMLRTTVRLEHPKARELRWLAEDFIYYLPFVGAAMNRIGAVRACQENAERLLSGGRLIAVFPEGAKGTGKLYRERYKLQRFGRGGFIRLCLRTQTPLVPCAIIGAEEANPMLYRIEYMTKSLGIPYIPITPTFPALGPLGLLPAPTKWKVRFGEAISFDGYGPEAADDEILVGRLADRVRSTIQGLIDAALAERRSIWFG